MTAKNPQPRQPRKPGRPAAKPKPGDGLLGWIGRQVGHVKKAVNTDVTQPGPAKPAKKPASQAQPRPGKQSARAAPVEPEPVAQNHPGPSTVVYRNDKIEEAEMPNQPGVKLRRTIIDEVIVVKKEGTP